MFLLHESDRAGIRQGSGRVPTGSRQQTTTSNMRKAIAGEKSLSKAMLHNYLYIAYVTC